MVRVVNEHYFIAVLGSVATAVLTSWFTGTLLVTLDSLAGGRSLKQQECVDLYASTWPGSYGSLVYAQSLEGYSTESGEYSIFFFPPEKFSVGCFTKFSGRSTFFFAPQVSMNTYTDVASAACQIVEIFNTACFYDSQRIALASMVTRHVFLIVIQGTAPASTVEVTKKV